METLLKTIVIIIVAFLAVRFMSAHRRVTADSARAQAAAVAAAKIAAGASPNGLYPFPAPFTPPSDRLLILAPPNCPSAEGRRADALVRGLNNDGIRCTRSGNISIKATQMPTAEEQARLDEFMRGPLPIVFVNGRVSNNPTIDEIEAEVRGR